MLASQMDVEPSGSSRESTRRAIAFGAARVVVSVALLALASLLWKYLWTAEGRTINETIIAFLGAMSLTGAAFGTPMTHGVRGAFIGLGLAIAWCVFLATLVITGIQGF
ncbi:MAG: hypothetical protein ACK5LO_05325 [Leucobacter sp.]